MARRAQTIQADLRDARLRLAADDLVVRRAEFEGADNTETTLRREHDEAAARLAVATEALATHEAARGHPLRAHRRRPADLVPALGAGRTGQRDACASPANARSTWTPSPPRAPGRTPTRWRPRPSEVAAREQQLLAELAAGQLAPRGSPRRPGRQGTRRGRGRTRPHGRGARRGRSPGRPGPPGRSGRDHAGPGRVDRRRGGPADQRHRGGRRPRPAGQGRVRDRAEPGGRARPGRGRPRRTARPLGRRAAPGRRAGGRAAGRRADRRATGRVAASPHRRALRRTGTQGRRGLAGAEPKWRRTFRHDRQTGQGAHRLRGRRWPRCWARRPTPWPPTTSPPPGRRCGRSRKPTAAGPRSCSGTGPPRRARRPGRCPRAPAGPST